jgi:hypothetical protein
MPLFQTSVLNKYLAEQDKPLLEQQYALYRSYFLNATIQKNIIASKEEEFQEGFLRELFVKVLGYTINPEPDYNLKTELKNVKDSKKADGAIVDGEKVLAIIELKGTDTINLNQIEIQAFGYKNNQENCKYIITSNFQKLRFYIDNAIEFLEWDLFKLDFENFKLLYLCLGKDNIFKNVAAIIKVESVTVEENVTKRLYKEYSGFRKSLFNNIAELNANTDKLLLFKKTQKLLDRFLFLFFAEDRMLVPPNSVRKILEQWNSLKDMDAYQPLYARFKLYFGYLNTGHKGKQHDIFAYNGGLFAPDDVLDNIIIDDANLYEATLSLSNYDYNSEIDVNILGHIFEHSLTEIEELENEITSPQATIQNEKGSGKRKKDGVFYTPKYITKYIVENTIGTLCKNKKTELKIEEADYHPLQKKKALKILLDNLNAYRNWLLKITIIDPACGSGAFLNQALEFLIAEHKFISELEANITGSSIVFDVENSILENNLFGVDINEESVEIAKLSLWLRTARKGRKLNSLNNNIKCGNSLIDDETVAGDKAFIWEKEFPQVFGEYIEPVVIDTKKAGINRDNTENETKPYTFTPYKESETSSYPAEKITNYDDGIINTDFNIVNEPEVEYITAKKMGKGFDVVIGNPPWGAKLNTDDLEFLIKKYPLVPTKVKDSYLYFILLSLNILKRKGILGLIVPNTWLLINNTAKFRKHLLSLDLLQVIDHGDNVFTDAIVESTTIILNNDESKSQEIVANKYRDGNQVSNLVLDKTICLEDELNRIVLEFNIDAYNITKKLGVVSEPFSNSSEIIFGIKPYQVGHGIPSQTKDIVDNRIYHSQNKIDESWKPLVTGTDVNQYSLVFNNNEYIKYGKWLMYSSNEDKILSEKLLLRRTSSDLRVVFDSQKFYPQNSLFIITSSYKLKYILCLFNSTLFDFIYKSKCPQVGKVFAEVKPSIIKTLPIAKADELTQNTFVEKANLMLSKNIALQETTKAFIKLLQAKFETININTKLEKWYNLSFADFSKELSKQKIKLSLAQESEWLYFFEQEKQKALAIKNEIDTTDVAIDKMVYALYGLSEEEVRIVEGN